MVRVALIGVGLINGSLGLALRHVRRRSRRGYTVLAWSRSASSVKTAIQKGAVDVAFSDISHAVRNADIVALGTPVQNMAGLVKTFLPALKKGAVITDVGSVKSVLEKQMRALLLLRPDVRFVGAHPLAGSEKSGVGFASTLLFQRAVCVLTSKNKLVEKMWEDAGSHVVVMNARRHDEALALTSHWPHILAFALFSLYAKSVKTRPVLKNLTAGSFYDMTRIAGSDPSIWAGILQQNRAALLALRRRFDREIDALLSSNSGKLALQLQAISQSKQSWSK